MIFAESGLMGKIIFMLLIAAITWALFKNRTKPPAAADQADPGAHPVANADPATAAKQPLNPASAERMVACAACGVFMPESDSVVLNSKVSCREPGQCAHLPNRFRTGTGKN